MASVTLKGSCLCGSVHYEVSGEPLRFYHCHCSRCRKASGTGHATNLMVKATGLSWSKGAALLRHHKVPEAERFTNQFCSQCGSALPRQVPATDMVVIPAGSLDSDISLTPQAHIFWDSRANWSCGSEVLPTFAEYPT
ncbi:MAG: GFA family protein [Gammaproteobacteria bacterium]|nr:GFA family protein [Gammaproteobacteria bacterium]